ncbi:MAG: PulJ/GspJ family protein [Lentisphaeria bacterium]|jgi:hypothetical protein
MNRPVRHIRKHYTLVEIMVAVAILVIMMGFLFQFVIGAQRIWAASTRTGSLFEKAQIAFDVMETDLKNGQFSTEPGREIPFYVRKDGADVYLGLMSNFSSTAPTAPETIVDTYPVLYLFKKDNNLLYRCAVDDRTFDSISVPQWYCFGMDTAVDYFDNLINAAGSPFYNKLDKFDIIANGVEDVTIQVMPAVPATGYATARPKAVKVTLKLYDPEADNLGSAAQTIRKEETTRVFTKIIFMQ